MTVLVRFYRIAIAVERKSNGSNGNRQVLVHQILLAAVHFGQWAWHRFISRSYCNLAPELRYMIFDIFYIFVRLAFRRDSKSIVNGLIIFQVISYFSRAQKQQMVIKLKTRLSHLYVRTS